MKNRTCAVSLLAFVLLLLAVPAVFAAETRVICTFFPGDHVVCKDRAQYRPPGNRDGFGHSIYNDGGGNYATYQRGAFGGTVREERSVGAFRCDENGQATFSCKDNNNFPLDCSRDENHELQCSIPQSVLDADDSIPGVDR